MKTIVLSPQKPIENEIDRVINLFEEGLSIFHLRKPHYSIKKMKSYLNKIPSDYHSRIVVHSHHKLAIKYNLKGIHLSAKTKKERFKTWFKIRSIKRKNPWITISTSLHSINDLDQYDDLYDYVFLSPIFDSITSKDYQSGFKEFNLSSAVRRSNYKVVALGGVNNHNIKNAFNMGFWGCAFLGTIWTNESPKEKFEGIKEICNSFKNQSTNYD